MNIGKKDDLCSQRTLEVDRIKRGKWQPRKEFNQDKLADLASSIEAHGVIQPIVVKFDKSDGLYAIVSGERRWRASQLAMQFTLPVVVRNDLSEDQCRAIALVENLQREDLNPIEESEGLEVLIRHLSLTHKQAGDQIGKSRAYITNSLRLLDLDTKVQDYLRKNQLDVGHAKHLLTLPPRMQLDLATMAVKLGWSVRQVAKKSSDLKKIVDGNCSTETSKRNPDLNQLETLISDQFAMPTSISYEPKKGEGSITIKWHSIDELQGLLEAWGISSED